MEATDPVGFVGLGAIGAPIARALLAAGVSLVVYDQRAEAVERLASEGATRASSASDVADAASIVFASLPTPAVVREVAGDLVSGTRISTFVDLSTTGPTVAAEVATALVARGIDVLDAPVSGGVAGAEARTLTVMTAGAEDVFERVRPLLEAFGGNVVRVGAEPGQAQVAKLLNNLLSATAMAITSEVMTFGVASGLDPATLLGVFNASSGRNTATADKFPRHVLDRSFGAGFRLGLMAKDVELCLEEARRRRFPMLLGGLVQQLWTLAAAELDDPEADHTRIVELFEGWVGQVVAAEQVASG